MRRHRTPRRRIQVACLDGKRLTYYESDHVVRLVAADESASVRPRQGYPEGLPSISPVLGAAKPLWELNRDFVYVDAAGREHRVPHAYRFNGASIPWFCWNLVLFGLTPHDPRCVTWASQHDYARELARTAAERLAGDLLAREIIEFDNELSEYREWAIYRGVRLDAWWQHMRRRAGRGIRPAAACRSSSEREG